MLFNNSTELKHTNHYLQLIDNTVKFLYKNLTRIMSLSSLFINHTAGIVIKLRLKKKKVSF